MRVAVLYTCFNRKEKTLSSLKHLYEALNNSKWDISISVYLTDDNSSDATSEAVASNFPAVKILHGNGELYWAGGMRNSWGEALKREYDAYLLLNDDTETYYSLFNELLETHSYSIDKYGKGGVYIGTTQDKQTQKLSYGGAVFTNKIMAQYLKVIPNGQTPQECELGNANIMMVHKDVVDKIGILSKGYVHGLADFDYTLKAGNSNIPVIITPNYLGSCTNDHSDTYQKFSELSLGNRWKMLHNPIGGDTRMVIKVFPNAVLTIGDYTGISNSAIICQNQITNGNYVKIGGSVKIYDTDFHSLNYEGRKDRKTDIPVTKEIKIGNHSFIGAHSIILKGVQIGEKCIVGAGSVVTKSIPDGEIWGGNPAKFIKNSLQRIE